MKKIFFAIGIVGVMLSGLLLADIVFAKKTLGDAGSALSTVSGKAGIQEESISTIVGVLVQNVLTLAGVIFFILAVYSGLIWMTSRGNEERVTKARNTLIASVIGLVILVSAYAITNFIQTRVIDRIPDTNQTGVIGSDKTGEPLGCCLDWINTISDPAARWTTENDCKKFGEMPSDTDVWCDDGPKNDCWTWDDKSDDMPNIAACLKKSADY